MAAFCQERRLLFSLVIFHFSEKLHDLSRPISATVTTGRRVSGQPSGDGTPKRCFRLPQGNCGARHPPTTPPASLATAGRQVEAVSLRTGRIYPHGNHVASLLWGLYFQFVGTWPLFFRVTVKNEKQNSHVNMHHFLS